MSVSYDPDGPRRIKKDPDGPRIRTKKDQEGPSKQRQTGQAAFAASSFSSWFILACKGDDILFLYYGAGM